MRDGVRREAFEGDTKGEMLTDSVWILKMVQN